MQNAQGFKVGLVRLIAAAAIVIAGVLFVSPGFDPDTDGDGVADAQEISIGTDPSVRDAELELTARTTQKR